MRSDNCAYVWSSDWLALGFVFVSFNQVTHSQESQEESQTPLAQTVFPTEIKDLQAELQDKLRTLHEEQDQVNILDDDKVLKVNRNDFIFKSL